MAEKILQTRIQLKYDTYANCDYIYKQYTYARNVIQWNLDIFNSGKKPSSGIKLRDDETEGYNIIPNFFIAATMDEKYRYAIDGIKETDRKKHRHIL